ncbi:alpha/beta fold hydrolase [Prauserella sp. ASG 168]|uniref:Alpha/beta fold hydrolase n=1 Tax=Prauserella cavernicola TaxID=2800127 RepID=A0A934V1W8_9PSEU|nr:alpha/beta fold hydrolase [Prauserella cavernicola]
MTMIGLSGSMFAVPAVAADEAAPKENPGSTVKWGPCPEDVAAEAAPSVLECGTVPVPMDYSNPDGPRIDIAISRLASQNPEKRRGVLMLHPGGPTSSGLSQPGFLVQQGLPTSVSDSYDVIGMDSRGIARSAPVSCGFTPDSPYTMNVPPYAPDDAAVLEQAEVVKSVAEQCAANDEDGTLKHFTTANTARDMDRIRAALGEEKTSFLGYSYGSALGAAYASMFPERSDRIVLDSNLGDTHLDRDGLRRYAQGMEDSFPTFAKWAAERDDSYGLGSTAEEVRQTYFELAEKLDETPVEGMDGALFRMSVFGSLFSEQAYPQLAQSWQSMRDPDGQEPQPAAGEDAEAPDMDNSLSVFLTVTCNDVEWPEDVDTYRKGVEEDRVKYPLFGAATANILPCAFWEHEPVEPPVAVNDEGPENILITQNLRDPATPHSGGELMREKFEDRSRLVSVDATGHGAYLLSGNSCALDVTTNFLVDGEMPKWDKFCRAG